MNVSGAAVCTSGGYERPRPGGQGHHIVDPSTALSPSNDVTSVTVIAPTTMLADALATAAFVLGPERAVTFLEQQGAEGLVLRASGPALTTSRFVEYLQ